MQHKAGEFTTLASLGDSYFRLIKGYSLNDWIRDQKDLGYSYRAIASRLEEATDGALKVSYRTIARWANP